MTSALAVVLFLSAVFGGTVRAERLEFESPEACARFLRVLERATVRHEILRPCDPAPAPRATPTPRALEGTEPPGELPQLLAPGES